MIPNDTSGSDHFFKLGYLFVFKNKEIQSLRLADGQQADHYTSFGGYDTPAKVGLSPGSNHMFGWNEGISPASILRIGYDPATGLIDDFAFSDPYHGDFGVGRHLLVEPSGQRILDRGGIAYRGVDLTYISGLGGYARDAAFSPNHVLLVRDDQVVMLDGALRETGVVTGTGTVHGGTLHGQNAFLFGGPDGMTVTVRPLSEFGPLPPLSASSPLEGYQPSKVEMSDFGVIHLFDAANSTVHRFDVDSWSHLPSLGLPAQTKTVSLDTKNEHLYLGQEGGRLSVVPRNASEEVFLAYSPPELYSLGAMDNLLMTADPTGSWSSHRVFDGASGDELVWSTWNHEAQQFTWSRGQRRMYFFRDGTSPNDLHYESISANGMITGTGETPLHGGVITIYPIRVQPAGAYVLLGSGQLFDGVSLALLGSLGETMTDAAWIGTSLYTLRPSSLAGRSELVRWSSGFTALIRGTIPGTPIALFARNGALFAVTRIAGHVQFFSYPASLAGTNVASSLTASQSMARPGDSLEWIGMVVNQGMGPMEISAILEFDTLPHGLSLLCEVDGDPIPCSAGNPIAQTLAAGSTLIVQAWGSMPEVEAALAAILTVTADDASGSDNQSTAVVNLDPRIFYSGFESP